MLVSILNAITAIPQIAGYVESAIQQIVLWWVQRQQSQTLSEIADAAALASHAQTDADRYAAAQAWQSAIARGRTAGA